jgi:hypothetical protein
MPTEPGSWRTPPPPDAVALLAVDRPPGRAPRRVGRHLTPLIVAGVASLANGVALLLYILGGVPLPILLAFTWTVAALALVTMSARGNPATRVRLRRYVGIGLAAGLAATLAYDVTKAILSQLDPSPFNPFEATRIFGTILVGPEAPAAVIAVVGWAFHITNGCTFAIAFACLFARDGRISFRRGILSGMAWGVFLETFQLALFPGWLNIRFLDEFRQISFLSHLVYGATIGILVPAGLRWSDDRRSHIAGGLR